MTQSSLVPYLTNGWALFSKDSLQMAFIWAFTLNSKSRMSRPISRLSGHGVRPILILAPYACLDIGTDAHRLLCGNHALKDALSVKVDASLIEGQCLVLHET